jgi:hypothetical protein
LVIHVERASDAGFRMFVQQCLWHTSGEIIEAPFTVKMVVNLVHHATYPNQQ